MIDSNYCSDEKKKKELEKSDWTVVQKPKIVANSGKEPYVQEIREASNEEVNQ